MRCARTLLQKFTTFSGIAPESEPGVSANAAISALLNCKSVPPAASFCVAATNARTGPFDGADRSFWKSAAPARFGKSPCSHTLRSGCFSGLHC